MDIQQIKLKMLSWLESIEDEHLLRRINQLIEQAKAEDFEAAFPALSIGEMQERLDAALKDGQEGNVQSHSDLKAESEDW